MTSADTHADDSRTDALTNHGSFAEGFISAAREAWQNPTATVAEMATTAGLAAAVGYVGRFSANCCLPLPLSPCFRQRQCRLSIPLGTRAIAPCLRMPAISRLTWQPTSPAERWCQNWAWLKGGAVERARINEWESGTGNAWNEFWSADGRLQHGRSDYANWRQSVLFEDRGQPGIAAGFRSNISERFNESGNNVPVKGLDRTKDGFASQASGPGNVLVQPF